MTAIIIRGDARRLPLPDASVDLICTSPPYWVLRDYQDDGASLDGQIGNEASPELWLDAMCDCIREWQRVMKGSASLFLNCGDKYLEKGLVGLPWRLALRCIDDLGLILRAEIIWDKPNGLPESVTDRVRRSHEQWFHLVKQPRYYSAIDEVREPSSDFFRPNRVRSVPDNQRIRQIADTTNSLGKLPGSVWSIPSQPLTVPAHLGVDHFAAFPCEWPRRIILGWTPSGICVECGEGRRPVAAREYSVLATRTAQSMAHRALEPLARTRMYDQTKSSQTTITGYTCACPDTLAPTRPAVVLDPFGGTGTTALVASALGRTGITVDLSHDYSRIAQWRTHDPAERAKALHVDKPPPQLDGQLDMWEGALT